MESRFVLGASIVRNLLGRECQFSSSSTWWVKSVANWRDRCELPPPDALVRFDYALHLVQREST